MKKEGRVVVTEEGLNAVMEFGRASKDYISTRARYPSEAADRVRNAAILVAQKAPGTATARAAIKYLRIRIRLDG